MGRGSHGAQTVVAKSGPELGFIRTGKLPHQLALSQGPQRMFSCTPQQNQPGLEATGLSTHRDMEGRKMGKIPCRTLWILCTAKPGRAKHGAPFGLGSMGNTSDRRRRTCFFPSQVSLGPAHTAPAARDCFTLASLGVASDLQRKRRFRILLSWTG